MNDLRSLFLLLCTSFMLISCFGDDSPSELLSSGTWEAVDEISYDPIEETETSILADCRVDDTYSFYKNGKFIFETGFDLCAPDETDYFGTWELSEDEKRLKYVFENGTSITYNIGELTKNRLELYYEGDPIFGFQWRTARVFSR